MNYLEAKKQIDNYKALQKAYFDSQFDDNLPSYGSPIQPPQYIACLAVSCLLKEELDPENLVHRNKLYLANKLFTEDHFSDYSSEAKIFLLHVASEVNEIKNNMKIFKKIPESVTPFTDLGKLVCAAGGEIRVGAGVAVQCWNPLIEIFEKIGLLSPNKILSYEDINRCISGLGTTSLCSLLENPPKYFNDTENNVILKQAVISLIKEGEAKSKPEQVKNSSNSNAQAKIDQNPNPNYHVETDPILQNMVKFEKGFSYLAEEFESNASETIPGKDCLLNKVDDFEKKAETFISKLQDNKKFIEKAFECAQKVAEAILQNQAAKRHEKQAKYEIEKLFRDREHFKHERQNQFHARHFNPSELELLAIRSCHPIGLGNSLQAVQAYSKEYRNAIEELQAHIEKLENDEAKIKDLSKKIDATDEVYIKLMNKAREAHLKTARALRRISTALRIASAVLAFVPGVNAAAQAASTAFEMTCKVANLAAIAAQVGQENCGAMGDRYLERIRNRENENRFNQNRAGNLIKCNQNQIAQDNALLDQAQMDLLRGNPGLSNEAYRHELDEAIQRNIVAIDKLKVGEAEQELNDAKSKLDQAEAKVNKLDKCLRGCKCKRCKVDKNKADSEFQKEELNVIEKQKILDNLIDQRTALEKVKLNINNKLRNEEYIKLIADEVERIANDELAFYNYDFDEKGKLSNLGLAQQALREGFSVLDEARRQKREFFNANLQILRGFCAEITPYANNNAPIQACELAGHVYQMYDQYVQLKNNCSIFEGFKDILDNGGLASALLGVGAPDLIAGYLGPAFRLATTGLGLLRMAKALQKSQPQFNSEIEWLASFVNQCSNEQVKEFRHMVNNLTEHMDDRFDELKEQINGLYNYVKDIKDEIISVVKEGNADIKKSADQRQWLDFKNKIASERRQLRSKHDSFIRNIGDKRLFLQKDLLLEHLNNLLGVDICDKSLNGKTIAIVEDFVDGRIKKKIDRGLLPYMSLHPKAFVGAYASKLNKKFKEFPEYPNVILLQEMLKEYNELADWLNNRQEEKYDQEISRKSGLGLKKNDPEISKKMKELSEKITKQKTLVNDFVYNAYYSFFCDALESREECVEIASSALKTQKKLRKKCTKIIIKKQLEARKGLESIKTPSKEIEKYFFSDLVNKPLCDTEKLNLNNLHYALLGEYHAFLGSGINFLLTAGISSVLPTNPLITFYITGNSLEAVCNIPQETSHILNKAKEQVQMMLGRKEINLQAFYDGCESKILDILHQPLGKLEATARITDQVAFQKYAKETSSLAEIMLFYELSNLNKKFKLKSLKYKEGSSILDPSKNNLSKHSENIKSLFDFNVKCDLSNLSCTTEFSQGSAIQMNDIHKLKAITPITQELKDNEKRLQNDYLDFVNKDFKELKGNKFSKMMGEGELIPSCDGKFLPLILPKNVLETIERGLFSEIFELISVFQVLLMPSFDFKLDASKEKYTLTLQYKFYQGNEEIEFCSFNLAKFDKATVECNKQIDFSEYAGDDPDLKGRYDYEISAPDLQEFLLKAMYAGDFKAALPGKGTVKLENVDLYVPNLQKFNGLFRLWQQMPTTIDYQSWNNNGQNPNFFGSAFRPEYSASYLLNMGVIKRAIASEDKFKQALQKYEESYYLFKGVHKLNDDLKNLKMTEKKSDNLRVEELDKMGLFSPANKEELLFNFYLNGYFQTRVPSSDEMHAESSGAIFQRANIS